MAILKKKMAGKPMMKKRKAQGGINLAKDPNTDEKNALKDVPSEGKMLSNVNTKERGSAFSTAAKSVKNFLKEDFLGAKDPGRTAVGKTLRKVGNTAIKTAYAQVSGEAMLYIVDSLDKFSGKFQDESGWGVENWKTL
jgi:hypothetical protein